MVDSLRLNSEVVFLASRRSARLKGKLLARLDRWLLAGLEGWFWLGIEYGV
jgi:hypothetical protein